MACVVDVTCYCSLEEGVRQLWRSNANLNVEIPVTDDEATNRFDVDGTMFGKYGQYAYLQSVGETFSRRLGNRKFGVEQYRLWVISCDKSKRDEISNRAHRELGRCPSLLTEEGNICKVEVGRPTKSYDTEECVFLASSNVAVAYSVPLCRSP